MPKSRVEYVIKNAGEGGPNAGELEAFKVGNRKVFGDSCVRVWRFGNHLVDFVASAAQVKRLRSGAPVRVTTRAVRQGIAACRFDSGMFSGTRKRRRR
jgi:hypothetical protein